MPMPTSGNSHQAEMPSDQQSNQWWSSQSAHELVLPVTTQVSVPACPKFFERSLLEADAEPVSVGRLLPILWACIGVVCAYYVYLTVKYPDFLKHLEENPLGIWLLKLDGGCPALFMGVKFFSSMLVLSVLILSHRWYSRLCWVMTVSVTLFQLWLTAFLTFI